VGSRQKRALGESSAAIATSMPGGSEGTVLQETGEGGPSPSPQRYSTLHEFRVEQSPTSKQMRAKFFTNYDWAASRDQALQSGTASPSGLRGQKNRGG